jgi:hypothetical protein
LIKYILKKIQNIDFPANSRSEKSLVQEMKKKYYLFLLLISLCVNGVTVAFQSVPGYMDAAYYYVGGQQLATGKGFFEPFIWNYLDNPEGLPHPSHTYWMPLPSLLAAAGMKLTGGVNYLSARVLFIILSALISPLTALICYRFTNQVANSLIAGGFALFSGFYQIFSTATETFSLYMVLGGIFFLMISQTPKTRWTYFISCFILGIIAGLMHLTRADGILWLLGGLGVVMVWSYRAYTQEQKNQWEKKLISLGISMGCVIAGYIILMAPWFYRNYVVFGTLFSPGGAKTLWITNYDQTFILDTASLTFKNWLSTGWQSILQARLTALNLNLQTLLGVQTEVFQLPLLIIGIWVMRRDFKARIWLMMWLGTFGVMTAVFPFSGSRGGYFHSSAALQPVLWVFSAKGLEYLLMLGVKWRHWNMTYAKTILGGGSIALALVVTIFLFQLRVIGENWRLPIWGVSWVQYQRIENELELLKVRSDEIIFINDPPSFYAVAQRPAFVIPDGDEKMILEAAKRYQGTILVLEKNHPVGLNNLYDNPYLTPDLDYLGNLDEVKIFSIRNTD